MKGKFPLCLISNYNYSLLFDFYTFDSFVSDGTLGMRSLRYENAELMLNVLRRSFLFAVFLLLTTRTTGGPLSVPEPTRVSVVGELW